MTTTRSPARSLAIRALDRFTTIILLVALVAFAVGAATARVSGIR
jgi:hypothetical protein